MKSSLRRFTTVVPFTLLTLALPLSACGKKGVPSGPDASAGDGSASQAKGLAHPDNDPALNAFANGIMDCRFAEGIGFSGYGPCEPLEGLKKMAKDSKKTLPTMLNWIEDESPPIRAAAAGILWNGGSTEKPFATCEGGERVKAALYSEVLKYTGWELALAWHQFVRFCPAQDAEMQTFVRDAAFPLLMARQELVPRLSGDVVERAGWYETLVDVVLDEQQDAKVRQGVPTALARVPRGKQAAATTVIQHLLKSRDTDLSANSAEALAALKIDDAFPDILRAAKADLAAGAKHSHFFYAIASYTRRPDAKIDKPAAFKLAKSCARSAEANAGSRMAALDILEGGKAPTWQKTAEAIKPPDDKLVVEHAQRLLAQAASSAAR